MYIVTKHKAYPLNTVLAIIDKELLGKKIEEDNKLLDLSTDFYKGKTKSEEEVLEMIKQIKHLNVVGKRIVSLLKQEGFIETIAKIDNIPYAQILISEK